MQNIVLVGFMGTGKSAVGKKLSEQLGMKFVEMDDYIEKREGMIINDIFSNKGEPYFRDVETAVAREIGEKESLIISAGGGCVLRKENVEALGENGILICLNATEDEIFSRVKDRMHRPLLHGNNPKQKIRELLQRRKPYYDKIEVQINTTGKTIDQVANEVEKVINKENNK